MNLDILRDERASLCRRIASDPPRAKLRELRVRLRIVTHRIMAMEARA